MIPVTEYQIRYSLLEQAKPSHLGLFTPLFFDIQGELDVPTFQKAFGTYVNDYHLGIHGDFNWRGEQLFWCPQKIAVQLEIFTHQDIQGHAPRGWLIDKIRSQPLDVSQGKNYYAALLSVSRQQHYFGVSISHLLTDTLTGQFFVEAVSEIYQFYLGQRSELPPKPKSYHEIIDLMRQINPQPPSIETLNALHIPWPGTDDLRVKTAYDDGTEGRAHVATLAWGASTTSAIAKFAKSLGAVPWMVLLAVYALMLQKKTGQSVFCLSYPVNIRTASLRKSPGCWANHSMMVVDLAMAPSLHDLVLQIKSFRKKQRAIQHVPWQTIRDAHHQSPQITLNFAFTPAFLNVQTFELPGCQVKGFFPEQLGSFYDIDLGFEIYANETKVQFKMATQMFEDFETQGFAAAFRFYLHHWLRHPELKTTQLSGWREVRQKSLPDINTLIPRSSVRVLGQLCTHLSMQQKILQCRDWLQNHVRVQSAPLAIQLNRSIEKQALIYAAWAESISVLLLPSTLDVKQVLNICQKHQVYALVQALPTVETSTFAVYAMPDFTANHMQPLPMSSSMPVTMVYRGIEQQVFTVEAGLMISALMRLSLRLHLSTVQRIVYCLDGDWDNDVLGMYLGLVFDGEIIYVEAATPIDLKANDLLVTNLNIQPQVQAVFDGDILSVTLPLCPPKQSTGKIWQLLGYPLLGVPLSCQRIHNKHDWRLMNLLLELPPPIGGMSIWPLSKQTDNVLALSQTAKGWFWLGVVQNARMATLKQKIFSRFANLVLLALEQTAPEYYTIIFFVKDNNKLTATMKQSIQLNVQEALQNALWGFRHVNLYLIQGPLLPKHQQKSTHVLRRFSSLLWGKQKKNDACIQHLLEGHEPVFPLVLGQASEQFKTKLTGQTNSREPLDPIENQLWSLWRSHVPVSQCSVKTSLLQLGASSLQWLDLLAAINRHFDADFSIHWLMQHPCIASQATHIKTITNTPALFQPVVRLNTPLDKPPLILFPPALMGAESYAHLAYLLDGKIPVIALDSYNLHSGQARLNRVEGLADYYIQALAQQDIKPPWILGGWSLGGNIAFEVANQLGTQPYPLFLIDSYNLSDADIQSILLFVKLKRMANVAPGHIADYFLSLSQTEAKTLTDGLKHDLKMLLKYEPKPYKGQIISFKATQKIIVNFDRKSLSQNGWERVCQDIEVVKLDVNHQKMMYQGDVAKLAQALEQAYLQVLESQQTAVFGA